jgi:hypothetical protein
MPVASNSSPPTKISGMNCNHSGVVPFVRYTAGLLAKQYIIKQIAIMYYAERDSNGVGMNINTEET